MDWLIYLIVGIVIGTVCFAIGWKVAIHPDIISNERALEKQKELNLEINTQEARIEILKNEKEKLQQQYNETQQFISDAEKNAETIYATKCAQLEDKFKAENEQLSKRAKELAEQYEADLQKTQDALESLRATKAAAIEAARKEKLINRKQEDYCLRVPVEEQNDIAILKSVRNRITKPRAISTVIWSAYFQPLAKKQFPQILGVTDVCGIYKITNQKTGECYIGQAKDVRKRWNEHCRAGIGIDTPQGNKLYKAMQEYGLEYFSFELLEECTADKLNEKERYFIELYSADTLGYNSTKGVK